MIGRQALVLASLASLAAACESAGPSPWTGTDSSGVSIVTVHDLAALPVDSLQLDADWAPAGLRSFGNLVDVEPLPDDRVALLDAMAAAIVIVAADGARHARFGREGEGPGELNPRLLQDLVATDTSILVPDLSQQRVTEFSFEGDLLGIRSLPGTGGYLVDWRPGPDGGVLYRVVRDQGDLVVALDGERADTIHGFSWPPLPGNALLGRAAIWDVGDSLLLVGTSAEWEIRAKRVQGGDVVWILRGPTTEREIGAQDRRILEDLVLESAAGRPRSEIIGETQEAILERITFPSRAPALAEVVATGPEVWIRTAAPIPEMSSEALRVGSARGYGGREWLAVTMEGIPQRRVVLPAGFEPRAVAEGFLYGIVTDDVGVASPSRLGLERPSVQLRAAPAGSTYPQSPR